MTGQQLFPMYTHGRYKSIKMLPAPTHQWSETFMPHTQVVLMYSNNFAESRVFRIQG